MPVNLDWIRDNITQVALVLVMGIGVLIILGSRKSRWGENLSTAGIVILGLIFIAVPAALLAAARGTGSSLLGGGWAGMSENRMGDEPVIWHWDVDRVSSSGAEAPVPCEDNRDGWVCARPDGHSGAHRAEGYSATLPTFYITWVTTVCGDRCGPWGCTRVADHHGAHATKDGTAEVSWDPAPVSTLDGG